MKKVLIHLCSLLLIVSLSACGYNDAKYNGTYQIEGNFEGIADIEGELNLSEDKQELLINVIPNPAFDKSIVNYEFEVAVIKDGNFKKSLIKNGSSNAKADENVRIQYGEYSIDTIDGLSDEIDNEDVVNNLYVCLNLKDEKGITNLQQVKLNVTKIIK